MSVLSSIMCQSYKLEVVRDRSMKRACKTIDKCSGIRKIEGIMGRDVVGKEEHVEECERGFKKWVEVVGRFSRVL